MCMQSVSLWAEATWYRLGGGHNVTNEISHDAAAEPEVPVETVDAPDEKVLVSR